jgi:AraC-like DNA-binding protein
MLPTLAGRRAAVLNAGAPPSGDNEDMPRDWAHYWRSAGEPLEAMHAHFERHVYHRHSHESYSLGVAAVRRAATASRLPGPGAAPAGAASVAVRTRQLITDRYLDDLTAGDLAAAAGVSRFTIFRAFVSVYGMAPSDYQRQLRLRAAQVMIASGTPISEAAAQAGFADQSHLTRWFSRCYGVTPAGYRSAGQ